MLTSRELYDILVSLYGEGHWWSDDPYTVIFQSVLVQNTTWNSVKRVTESFSSSLTPEHIELMQEDVLDEKIKLSGCSKRKAKTIKTLTSWYLAKRDCISLFSTKELRSELLAVCGVGEETADVILVYAFYRPSFIIDAYTRRFLLRLGYRYKTDEERRNFFISTLEEDATIYGSFHWIILEHSLTRCMKNPKCADCVFSETCDFRKNSDFS